LVSPHLENLAAVCILDKWIDEEKMQMIGAENNLAETAFIVRKENDFEIRWFTPSVEVDENYIGGQWKNKRHSAKAGGSKRGRRTSKTPVFSISCRGRKVWAQVVDNVEAKTLLPLISRWVKLGCMVCSDTWKSYTGVAANGYVHRW